jgi:hypothetical protein
MATAALTWEAIAVEAVPVRLESGARTTLTVGPKTTVDVALAQSTLSIDGKPYALHKADAEVTVGGTSLRFRLDRGRLFLSTTKSLTGSIILHHRLRPVIFAGNVLVLDLDGDRKAEGDHEIVFPGEPFPLGGKGYVAALDGGVLRVRPSKEVPARRARAWTPPAPPDLQLWAQLIPSDTSHAKLVARYKKERKARRREKYPDIYVKRYLHGIGLLKTKRAFAFLWEVYEDDPNVRVRSVAVEAMGFPEYIDHADKIESIARGNADTRPSQIFGRAPTYKIHAAAVEALHFMGAPGRDLLYHRLLDAGDTELSGAAARCLGYTGTREAQETLGEILDFRIGTNPTGLDDLYRGARHGPAAPKLGWMLAVRDRAWTRDTVLRDLFVLGYPQARDQALALIDEKRQIWLQEDVELLASVLATAGDAEAVRAALAAPVLDARETLRRLLPAVRDPAALDVLVEALDTPAASVALDVLSEIRTPKIAAELRRRLKEKPTARLVFALGQVGDGKDRGVILAAATKDKHLQVAAAQALARLGTDDEASRGFVARLATSDDWQARVAALHALTTPAGVLENITHERWPVRLAAVRAARRLDIESDAITARRAAPDETLRVKIAAGAPPPKNGASIAGITLGSDRIIFLVEGPAAANQIASAIKAFPETARANAMILGEKISAWKKEVTPLTPAARRSLASFLRRAKSTQAKVALEPALDRAFADPHADTIVIVSRAARWYRPARTDRILEHVSALDPTRSTVIHGVALGGGSGFLRRLAAAHGGGYAER